MNRRSLLLTVLIVFVVHMLVISLIVLRPTTEIIPKQSLPYLPPPEVPNFGTREYRYIDPETGERVVETRFVVSTKLFSGEATTSQAQSKTAEDHK